MTSRLSSPVFSVWPRRGRSSMPSATSNGQARARRSLAADRSLRGRQPGEDPPHPQSHRTPHTRPRRSGGNFHCSSALRRPQPGSNGHLHSLREDPSVPVPVAIGPGLCVADKNDFPQCGFLECVTPMMAHLTLIGEATSPGRARRLGSMLYASQKEKLWISWTESWSN